MKSSAVCSLLLWQAAIGATYTAQKPLKNKPTIAKVGDAGGPTTDLASGAGQPVVKQQGADLVDVALSELQKVPLATRKKHKMASGLLSFTARYLLKVLPTMPVTGPTQKQASTVSGPVAVAKGHLESAAAKNNSDALYLLAELNFFGYHNYPRDLKVAFDYYQQLAAHNGNKTAQYMLGLFYSSGLGNAVPQDQAKALLYYTLAAKRGDPKALMAIAYRHQSGVGTLKSCETAIGYYKEVADKAIDWYRDAPPGGQSWIQESWRISDDDGGIYGEGASASSAGLNALKRNLHSNDDADISDVIEYLDLMSQKSDSKASFNLGRLYYEGQRGLEKDFESALKYFFLAASRYWKRDGRATDGNKNGADKTAAEAAGFIGRMYLRGDGVAQNFDKAKAWFERGKSHGDAQSQWGLGMMLLNGLGIRRNIKLATELLRTSADQDFAPAQVQMGRLFLDQGNPEDVKTANYLFELAARYANIEALYYLAEMTNHAVGRERSCQLALTYYKAVAERAEPLVSQWSQANLAYELGNHDLAFLQYLMAAEQGFEKAQTNVAYMLDGKFGKMSLVELLIGRQENKVSPMANANLALIEWTRSSRQSNVDSLVKMGDYYFYGIGVEKDLAKAVQCYSGASDYQQSAQALFNLGWMHENGVGLTQDFHLAKRYYDHALVINTEAYLPVTLSLLKLRIRSAWNTFTHGPIHSIQDEPKKKKDWSLSEWINNFIEGDLIYEDDYYEDYYDANTIEGGEFLDDSNVLESLLIIGVTIALVGLVWWRQRIQLQRAEAEERRRREQGLPPAAPMMDPDLMGRFPGWAAGGMGF
ncbi:ubiquitin-protein ligase Sel1/Ubx2 [Akanthomyces lecanii RCEF 1005]|uniref:Ubiquitin-protein ligase Sel1/Ubx2 n=1 Tax=Akanthomyces lecanii RCEF 1005 TaxID=1081108 RepID=A0A162KNH2_CORDF|nr:ubiquitin-protein ligase Sel1/Ubx2 [Akanthomyces lecanii RCEF 1005]